MSEQNTPVYTVEMVENSSPEIMAALLNSHIEEVETLKKYKKLIDCVETDMKSGEIRLIAPVLSDGEFSEFLVVRSDAVHYSSKLIYVLDGRK